MNDDTTHYTLVRQLSLASPRKVFRVIVLSSLQVSTGAEGVLTFADFLFLIRENGQS